MLNSFWELRRRRGFEAGMVGLMLSHGLKAGGMKSSARDWTRKGTVFSIVDIALEVKNDLGVAMRR